MTTTENWRGAAAAEALGRHDAAVKGARHARQTTSRTAICHTDGRLGISALQCHDHRQTLSPRLKAGPATVGDSRVLGPDSVLAPLDVRRPRRLADSPSDTVITH